MGFITRPPACPLLPPEASCLPGLGLTPVQTGAIGSYALVGMFIGAILIGYLTDILGRRKVLMASIAFFSLLMPLTVGAPSAELFGTFRYLAGLGLGGVITTAIALTVEFSKTHRRNFNNALMFSGYAVGGILAALLSPALLSSIGFQGMLASGCLLQFHPGPRRGNHLGCGTGRRRSRHLRRRHLGGGSRGQLH